MLNPVRWRTHETKAKPLAPVTARTIWLQGLTTGNNQGIKNPLSHQHHKERAETCECPPGILRRQPVYEDNLSEDEEETKAILQGNWRGNQKEPDRQMFRMKMDLPSFNRQLQIKGFLDWLVLVERFFDYMDIPEDKKVKLVAYRLLGGAFS